MKGSKLLASSPTLERVRGVISEYFMGSTVTLTPWGDDSTVWTVATGRGPIPDLVVRLVRGRYRFERLPDGFTIAPTAPTLFA